MNEIVIDGSSLTFQEVVSVARAKPGACRIRLSDEAISKVNRASAAVQTLLDRGEVAYGITTGFGAFKDKIISREEVEQLQRNIVVSHAVGVGDPLDAATVRAIMLIRANTLASGFSGIRLETLELILQCIERGVHPVIPEKGSLGASGDLAPLAHFACVLIGEGKAEFGGEVMTGASALQKAGLQPVTLAAKEGLALTNGTTVMTAVGLLETVRARKLAEFADISGCLSLEALNGTVSAFDERIHALRPHPRQVECASNLRKILNGSGFVRDFDPTNVQDAYTLRCMPQVHGACRDAVLYAEWLLKLEYLAIALSELANISERRIMRLTDESSNARILPPFLTEHGGLHSGFMIVQYTAAALCTENKILAHPASVDTIPSSANVEDHVSMGATSALKLRQIGENLETVLALELLCAAQGIDLRKRRGHSGKQLGEGTRDIYSEIRSSIHFIEHDEFMKPHIDSAINIVRNWDR